MRIAVTVLLLVTSGQLAAQGDSSTSALFRVSGYLDLYYSYDFGNPADHERPFFLYNYDRHNEVNLNLGFMKGSFGSSKVRGNLALGVGTYMQANLAQEPAALRNIFEANAGIKVSRRRELWIDAGIMPSHIGFESAVGSACWTLSRGILAENSPYYESGIRLSYTNAGKTWYLAALVLNGWQRIRRLPGQLIPALGHQATWTPNSKLLLNSSSFVGNESPDTAKRMRYFHSLHATWQPSAKVGLIAGFDAGMQQASAGSSRYHAWYTPVIVIRYEPSARSAIAARAEYYEDRDGVIVGNLGLASAGYSLNYDRRITSQVLWRIEGRWLRAQESIFAKGRGLSHDNFALTTSLSAQF